MYVTAGNVPPFAYDSRVSNREEPLAKDLRTALGRMDEAVAGEVRVRSLLDAVSSIAGNLGLHATLERIVEAAAVLADAKFAALGVIDTSGEGLVDFITYGMSDLTVAAIGAQPRGLGILGLIIDEPHPLRLRNLNQHPASHGFPTHHPPMRSLLGVPVRVRQRVFGNLYLTDKMADGDFTGEDEQAVVALAAAAGVAIENARLYEQLRRRERWLSATAEIQELLLGQVDRGGALALIARRAYDITSSDLAVVVLEHDDGTLMVEAAAGLGERLLGKDLPRGGALSDVVDHGATVILAEGVRLPGLEGVSSALLVPFTGPGGAGGALLVGSKTDVAGGEWDDEDVQALRGFASQAALGIDRAQAQEDRAALAILADRDRIARDLHDLVIQRLFATGLTLKALSRRPGEAATAAQLTAVVGDLDTTIQDIRGTIFDLERDGAGSDLKGQIRAVVVAAESMLGVNPRVTLAGPLDSAVPDAVRPHLIAVIVEALSNAGRHAEATDVDVNVRIEGVGSSARVAVEVRDNGTGFTSQDGGNGLRNMRDRASDVGGSFNVRSKLGDGTVVLWEAPLDGLPRR